MISISKIKRNNKYFIKPEIAIILLIFGFALINQILAKECNAIISDKKTMSQPQINYLPHKFKIFQFLI